MLGPGSVVGCLLEQFFMDSYYHNLNLFTHEISTKAIEILANLCQGRIFLYCSIDSIYYFVMINYPISTEFKLVCNG